MGLPFDIFFVNIACFRIDGDLTRDEEELSNCSDREVRPDGFGDVGRDDSLDSFHKICLIKYKKISCSSKQKSEKALSIYRETYMI